MPPAGERSSAPVSHLEASGYIILREGDDHAVFNAGAIGPTHLTAHAHAHALSFVLWADGRPAIVDPGSLAYTGEPRRRFRSTAAHNTVEVDGRDQCELWGDFRAGHLPRVRAAPVRRGDGITLARASHDGYRRYPGGIDHHRALAWLPGLGVVIVDLLRGAGEHAVRSSLHLHPEARLDGMRLGPLRVAALGPGADPATRDGEYSPYLGRSAPAAVLEDRRTLATEVPFGWSLLREGARVSALDRGRLEVTRPDGSTASAKLDWG